MRWEILVATCAVPLVIACGDSPDPDEPSRSEPVRPGPDFVPADRVRPADEVDVLLERILDAEIESPLAREPNLAPLVVALGERESAGEVELSAADGSSRRYSVYPLDWPVHPDAPPGALHLRADDGSAVEGLLLQRTLQETRLAAHPSFRGFRSSRDALGVRRVLVFDPTRVRLPVVQVGAATRVRMTVRLGAGGSDRSADRERPTIVVRRDDAELHRLIVEGYEDGALEFQLPAALGTVSLDFEFLNVAPGSGDSNLMLRSLFIEHLDGLDRVLAPVAGGGAAQDVELVYPPAPPAAAQRLKVRENGEVDEEVLLLAERAYVIANQAQTFEVVLRGEAIEGPGGEGRESPLDVETSGMARLQVKGEGDRLRGDFWLVQPRALYLEPLGPLRGEEAPDAHPLVRHVSVEDVARRALLVPATTVAEFPVHVHRGDKLQFSLGTISLRERAAPRGQVDLRLSLEDATGHEHVLHEMRERSDAAWDDHTIPLPSNAVGACTLRWSTTVQKGSLATAEQLLVAWGEPTIVPAAPRARPNVLIYLIDTLRADHLKCYGYPRRTSPKIDQLSQDGVLFERAYSTAPWTRPAIASLFTSWYYGFHGAGKATGLEARLTTLAEHLRAEGFSTASFMANAHVHGTGLNFEQGFSHYVGVERKRGESRASDVNALVLPWLDRNHHRPFFLYVHTIDPHATYDPPPETAGRWNKGYEGPLDPRLTHARTLSQIEGLDERDVRYLLDLYDEEILFNDREFGKLVRKLQDLGVYEDTIVVVTADHGEEFFEHGGFGHGNRLWEELIQVPLILKLAGEDRPRGKRVDMPVSLVDLFPTLAALVGAPVDPATVHGLDLAPWWRGGAPGVRPPLLAEEEPSHRAYIDGDRKLIEWFFADESRRRIGVFDLGLDPREERDLAETDPEAAAELHRRMLETIADLDRRFPRLEGQSAGRMSAAQRAALEALGYLEPGGGSADGP